MTAAEIAQRLDAKKNGDGWKAKCPAHEDKTPSLSLKEGADGRVLIRCFAGCSVEDITRALKIEVKDLFNDTPMTAGQFIKHAHNNFPNATVVHDANNGTKGATHEPTGSTPARDKGPAPSFLPLTPEAIEQVAKWRGYSTLFVCTLSNNGVIGTYDRLIAFPVTGGYHFRKKDGGWFYTKGAKPNLFVLGEIEEGAHVHCFESQWDALAFADSQGECNNIVATRGASNVRLIVERLKGHSGTLYLWPQNDEPGQKWAADIAKALPEQQIKLAVIPSEHKDLNDWRKAGATDGDILNAYIDAKDFPVPVLAEPPFKVIPADTGEARESNIQPKAGECPASLTDLDGDFRGGENNFAVSKSAEEKADQLPSRSPDVGGRENNLEQSVTESAEPTGLDESPVSNPVVATGNSVASEQADSLTVPVGKSEGHKNEPPAPLAETLDQISEFLQRYVIFPDEEAQAAAIALWVAHAWCYKSFKFTPYLNVSSPEKRCGKTRLLECLQILVPKPQSFVRPTEATLFRTIEDDKPTLLLDEIDTIYSQKTKDGDEKAEGIRAVLNAGFQDGPFAIIPRCTGKNNEVQKFDTYCPKVIAGIGKNLPDTVRDRSIEIRLVRQTEDKKAARFRATDAETEAAPIREALDQWSREAGSPLAEARPVMPDQLSDRQQDMMEPLLAIADMAGDEWADKGRAAMIGLGAINEDASIGVQLLASCRQVFEATSKDKLSSNNLLGYLIEIEDANSPWATYWEGDFKHGKVHAPARSLARLLEPFGIEPKTIRLPDGETAKGYYKNDFADAWRRYLSPVKEVETMELGL